MTLKKTIFFCITVILFAGRLLAQQDFKIFLEFLPDSVTQNEAFTINLVVTHPNPEEIYVQPPGFNDAFRMERMRTEVRLVSDITRSSDQYTVFEFLLIPDKAGLQEIGSFEVKVLGKTKLSNPMTVYVQAAEENFNARLKWFWRDGLIAAADSVNVGAAYETVLRIISWEKGSPYPKTFPALVDAPENAIVEELPLSKNDRDTGIVLRLRIIPLDGKAVNINAKSVEYEKSRIEIPAFTIKVLPATDKFAAVESREVSIIKEEDTAPARRLEPVSFPGMMEGNKKVIVVFRRGADKCIADAERFWREGKYAAALAVLRNGEMTLLAASAIRSVRVACEGALHLPSAANELSLPRSPMFLVLIISTAAFAILFFVRKKSTISLFLLSAILFVFLLDLSALFFSCSLQKARAVLKHCAAYPIPEENVKAEYFFMEGEAVNIRSKSDSWVFVESTEIGGFKKSGWIKKEDAVIL
jgi:hypothetical protein